MHPIPSIGFIAAVFLCAALQFTQTQNVRDTTRYNNEVNLQVSSSNRIKRRGHQGSGAMERPSLDNSGLSAVETLARPHNNQTTRKNTGKVFVMRLAAQIQLIISRMSCGKAMDWQFTTISMCEKIRETSFQNMRFYYAPPKPNSVFTVAVPDGQLKRALSHYSVAVVDPFPQSGFGHIVMVFYVDKAPRSSCHRRKRIDRDGVCITMAKMKSCNNNFQGNCNSEENIEFLEVNFIPLVYDSTLLNEEAKAQLLECVPHIVGFGSCPKQLVLSPAPRQNCALTGFSPRCITAPIEEREPPHIRLCRLLATCDHAVALFGGWNNVTMQTRQEENLKTFYDMLRLNGFKKNDIQLFFGGKDYVPHLSTEYGNSLAVSAKLDIRDHVTTLCNNDLCVDSFVIYLNGPTTIDGSILLWDLNLNGVVEPNEIYTVDEFLDDITNCAANHIFIFADQSYAGVLTSSLRYRRSDAISGGGVHSWERVVLITSGSRFEYSWGRAATDQWGKLNQTHNVAWAFETMERIPSEPDIINRRHAEDHTIYGADFVDGRLDINEQLIEDNNPHMGCQKPLDSKWDLQFYLNIEQ